MDANQLSYDEMNSSLLKPYEKRGSTVSARFQRWFLENIFRTDPIQADDASIDKKHDKGIDGIFVDDTFETIYVIQTKVRQNKKSTLGDTDLKEFHGTLAQFQSADTIELLLSGNGNDELKKLLKRERIKPKIASGYIVKGIFCTNVARNSDAESYLKTIPDIKLYDSLAIIDEYVDLDAKTGISEEFKFDTSDSEIITYSTSDGYQTRFFLATALSLVHFTGITDQTLFSQNVRLALGNTKVNRSLRASIQDKTEHTNFPLYHNGITVLCKKIISEDNDQLVIKDYQVVNGAQSLTSLKSMKAKLSSDLKVLVKVVELGENNELSNKITHNSNNQNAIKGRDLKSNNPIQERLAKEVRAVSKGNLIYEVKRGELNKGKTVVSNEGAGLAILAMDVGEPWACHQKYKVMEDSHAKIFGRPSVNGAKVVALVDCLNITDNSLDSFDDEVFGYYTLTKYFLAYATAEIIKDSEGGRFIFSDFNILINKGKLDEFVQIFSDIASTTADDLNAEVLDLNDENSTFDYKKDLKSPNWCRQTLQKLKAQYRKDVKRNKAVDIQDLLSPLLN